MLHKIQRVTKNYIKSITIEPTILFYVVGSSILYGAQIETDLLIWKLCHIELGNSEEVCANLSLEVNEEVENDVQRELQAFETIGQWINSTPTLFLSFFMGSLSDKFGRKPLILFPLIGKCLYVALLYVNYRFIETLPVQFFYVNAIYSFLGGMPMYYLGVYSFGADASDERERGAILARMDGIEQTAMLLGVFLSPIIFQRFGYYGSFTFTLTLTVIAVLYLIFCTREKGSGNLKTFKFDLSKFCKGILKPVIELFQALSKKRPEGRRTLILIQIFTYCLYWFVLEEMMLRYVYMLKVFPGFDGEDYSYYTMYMNIRNAFGLLVLMPILSTKLQINEALLNTVIMFFECVGLTLSAFVTELWQYYLVQMFCILAFCKYALARAIMSKSVDADEIGKMFSGMSIMAALIPLISNPAFRMLYSSTLETFPSAFMLLAAASTFLGMVLNFYLFTQKHRLKADSNSSVTLIGDKLDLSSFSPAYPQGTTSSL